MSSSPSIANSTSSAIVATIKVPQESATMSELSTSPIRDFTSTSAPDQPVPELPSTTTTVAHTTSISTQEAVQTSSRSTSTSKSTHTSPPETSTEISVENMTTTSKQLPRTTTKVSVEAPKPTLPTSTSTITDQPESTFSSPVPISVIDSNNGHVSLSTPAVVTVLSTSTQPDGGFVTYTHVIANPTAVSDTQGGQTGFLANRGAVAGVTDESFRDENWEGHKEISSHEHLDQLLFAPAMMGGRNLNRYSNPAPSPKRVPVPIIDPFEDYTSTTGLIGHGTGYGHTIHDDLRKLDRASIAQSSPSIYPASLPPSSEDTDATRSPTLENSPIDVPHHKSPHTGAPPRPPRSHLRRSLTKPFEMYPITPPSSVSSHTPPQSPFTSLAPAEVVNRRTLLDVRPQIRPTQELTPKNEY
ncbi:hypothetical protein H0H87_000133 [Tephrocybe sp. NHM501043]|nr:hypothetical protein H0H87_000133 [Tephrocybe sp. NHM501043]